MNQRSTRSGYICWQPRTDNAPQWGHTRAAAARAYENSGAQPSCDFPTKIQAFLAAPSNVQRRVIAQKMEDAQEELGELVSEFLGRGESLVVYGRRDLVESKAQTELCAGFWTMPHGDNEVHLHWSPWRAFQVLTEGL
jgi:hypothetical protein